MLRWPVSTNAGETKKADMQSYALKDAAGAKTTTDPIRQIVLKLVLH
jgi:hypothetical protein